MDRQDELHQESLAKLKAEVGPSDPVPHEGGYLSQDEYATLIYYWAGEEHEGTVIDGVIATLANCSWAKTPQRELAVAGAVSAFCTLYPDRKEGWKRAYPELFARVSHAIGKPKMLPGWNDFLIAQWFVLRRVRREGIDIIDLLLDRVAEGGEVRIDALRAMNTCASQCKPFEIVWQRAANVRAGRMVFRV